MEEKELNKMWDEISKMSFSGTKAVRYRCTMMSQDEIDAINAEYHEKYRSGEMLSGWNACLSGSYGREDMDAIVKKHVAEAIVPISMDGRKQLMANVMDAGEKLLAKYGLTMPKITWLAFGSHTVYKDKIRLSALDFIERNVRVMDEAVFNRCMDMFCCYVYFYGTGVKEWFMKHGLTYTKRTGAGYMEWKKQVLASLYKETKKQEKKNMETQKAEIKENTTAACVTGTGENTTKANDVQAVVTETTVADVMKEAEAKNKKLWQAGTTVAKYLSDDGTHMTVTHNLGNGKFYIAEGKNGSEEYKEIKWEIILNGMKKRLAETYNVHTGRTLATCLMDAIMADITSSADSAGAVLEWVHGIKPRSEREILTAYGLL